MRKLASLALTATLATTAIASTDIEELKKRIESLEEKNQLLIDEIADLKQQVAIPELRQQQFAGMGYAASKVYFSPKGLSIGGYGEIIYQNWQSSTKKDYTDTYRFIPYIGYKFTDKIILNSEIEFEHTDEAKIEFLYIDFLFNNYFNIRVGNQLIPLGVTNLLHEPIFFNSVNRPEVETKIIPSTWNENGIMLFSNADSFTYYLGIVNGFYYNAKGKGFSSDSWVRNGRQAGGKAYAEDLAFVARFDYTGIDGLMAGISAYQGNSGQGDKDVNGNKIDGTVKMYDIHLRYNWKGFEITGLYVKGYLSDADKISTALGKTIGKEVYGYYVNLAYDVFPIITKNNKFSLPLFVRYERFNTQEKVPAGFTADKTNDKTIWTVGFNFKPHPNIILKADYQFRDNKGGGEPDVFELGMGFIF
ncbi:MAG: porin [Hydrogenothermus sp.]|nr:MAG: porin [Hydrogenothermus sp.]